MICWKDFVLDERFGPLLSVDSGAAVAIRSADVASVMEDGMCDHIQETGQERRPARMVGKSSLEVKVARRMDAAAASAHPFHASSEPEAGC